MKTHALTPKRESCWLEVTGSVARIWHDGEFIERHCNADELTICKIARVKKDVTAFAHVVIGPLSTERNAA